MSKDESDITQSVPLTRTEEGVFHIANSRVTLDSVIHQFKDGATAEQIQEDFPSLTLGDIYSVIAYYLQHTPNVEDYLREQAQAAKRVRAEVERDPRAQEFRDQIKRRRAHAAA